MVTNVSLPQWLDKYIFSSLNAKYCRSNSDMSVIDWDKKDMLNYLGTYFPRSYTESYCIWSDWFRQACNGWGKKDTLSLFDFCCGTGGEIIGLLEATNENMPNIKKVTIYAFDGNQYALRLFESIVNKYRSILKFEIEYKILPFEIDDFYDLNLIDGLIDKQFDIILTFKAICEFVTKERFEQDNAYAHICKCFLPKLKVGGLMLLVDVTTYNCVSQEWLPQMLDKGIEEVHAHVVGKNVGYNQCFTVSHSKCLQDRSKVAWRLIMK